MGIVRKIHMAGGEGGRKRANCLTVRLKRLTRLLCRITPALKPLKWA